ncbi:MAG: aspartate dehydrogenase, partial [Gemmobacter sp.]
GAIAQRIAALLAERRPPRLTLAAVAVRDPARARALPDGAALIHDPGALAALRPTLVVEAAGRAAVAPWGRAALAAGADFAPASTAAFADPALLPDLMARAAACGRQIAIAPGALAGIDALAAAGCLPLHAVRHEIVKPPAAWAGTAAEALCDLTRLTAPVTFWEGPADQTAARFPQNANVAMITALAGIGPAATTIALTADPAATRNAHRLTATGAFGTLRAEVENRPLPGNPKSSELTALAFVRLISGRAGPLAL